MLFVLFGVAGLYFLLDYTYLGAAQIAVYAGGVTMIYVFAIQLVSKQTLQGMVEHIKCSRMLQGLLLSVVGLATVAVVFLKNSFISAATTDELPMDQIGNALLGSDKYQYVLPFEFISVFLLACIIGGLVVSRKKED
jgi:NADH-quinone oxidoreductase subunit J